MNNSLAKFLQSLLASQLRHVATGLAAAAGWLVANDLVTPDVANATLAELNNAAANLVALVALVLSRWVMRWLGERLKLSPGVEAREDAGNEAGGGGTGGAYGLVALMWVTLPALGALSLVSCSTEHGTATPGWYVPSSPVDPAAKFGLLLEARVPGLQGPLPEDGPPPIVTVEK